jgi:hypothetical protein
MIEAKESWRRRNGKGYDAMISDVLLVSDLFTAADWFSTTGSLVMSKT